MPEALRCSPAARLARRRVLGLLPAAWMGLHGVSVAQSPEPVQVSVDDANPPFMFGRDGVAEGVYPAVVRMAFERMGTAVNVSAKPWKRVLFEVEHGQGGVAGIYKTEERSRRLDFSDPILVENIAVYYHQSRPVQFRGIADLHGLTVGLVRGWSYGDPFDAARAAGKFQVDEALSDKSSLLKLASGRVDVVLAIWEAGQAIVAAERLGQVVASGVFLTSNQAYLAFSKASQQTEWLERFNKALAEMKRDGSFKSIVAHELAR